MRSAFAHEITSLAMADDRVVLLSGDIGNRMFDDFKSKFPDRFYNCGIAEQSMISLGAGLAMCGLRPVAYTIAPFVTYRCLEQIRVDLCYHELPMVLVGVGAGLGYAELGATHHSCEDIAMLRALPGMSVICPGDAHEVRAGLRGALQLSGPAYLRIGKKGEPVVHPSVPAGFQIGKALTIREGNDVCLLSTGNTLPLAVEAGEQARVYKDAFGNVLVDGDTVTVIKDLKVKGSSSTVKVGTKVKNIRLVDGDHDIDCKIDGIGAMQLKTEFVKKA